MYLKTLKISGFRNNFFQSVRLSVDCTLRIIFLTKFLSKINFFLTINFCDKYKFSLFLLSLRTLRRFTWDIFDQKLSGIFRVILKVLPLIIESIIIIFISKVFLMWNFMVYVFKTCFQDIRFYVDNFFYFGSNMNTWLLGKIIFSGISLIH
jgi:hypothetical protein